MKAIPHSTLVSLALILLDVRHVKTWKKLFGLLASCNAVVSFTKPKAMEICFLLTSIAERVGAEAGLDAPLLKTDRVAILSHNNRVCHAAQQHRGGKAFSHL